MPRYIIYFIQYRTSIGYIITLDIKRSLRTLLEIENHINRRPIKRFTPKLIKELNKCALESSSIKYFTIELKNRFCSDTKVNMNELMSLIKVWEKRISAGEIEKITKLHIIP